MKKKGLMIAFALIMALGVGAGATLAYLFVKTDPFVNTFSYGNINIELKEHKYENGELNLDAEVNANTTYKVIPGVTEKKDPFVRVKAESEKCYIYVTVQNSVKLNDGTVVATVNIADTDWVEVATSGDIKLYRYMGDKADDGVVDASTETKTLQVFTEVTYDAENILKDNIAQVDNDTITVVAYAYQATNVEQDTADAAVKEMAGFTASTN